MEIQNYENMGGNGLRWINDYIGRRWESGASGPDTFNCWGLVRHVYLTLLGIELSEIIIDDTNRLAREYAFNNHHEYRNWQRVYSGKPLDVVVLSSILEPGHCGLYISGGVLHCLRRSGVVFQTLPGMRIKGWEINFYRYKEFMA